MATVVFVLDRDGYEHAFKSWHGMLGSWLWRGPTRKLKLLSIQSAPKPGVRPRNRTGISYATGSLAAQIVASQGHFRRELEGRVVALPKWGLYVHEGTRPHVIRPKKVGALRFFWHKRGHVVTLQKVNHPGTRRNPFMAENLRSAIR
jgi:hypothetical protein